ncbi:nitrate reductase molybdenum cofactor assembly chaperone [Nonomuraea wenchangensis]|uniref:Nitrate reductase molybdenum cofactor assembly chaperone n=1 Tax=Nonomuraea wenchangensis TaxID=568860 RepID=A0A1I0KQ53_9ACTN|nr:nitrate reductase molybdenum cofactor assembly chaperone [Nonomuraea wenchangensis]SEU27786.1 nitrate reductase molybdenum cofactor assembly chaperone [Nonomuraea wenchangensis]
MRGRRRKPRPPIPWRSPWTFVVCLAGGAVVAAIAVTSAMAKDVVVVVDGKRTAVRSFAASVRDALGDAGVALGYGDVVRPPAQQPLADGATIEVRRARPIKLTLDGRTSEHLVTSTDVAGALAELAIPAAAGQVSAPPDEAVPLSGMALTVYTRRKVYVVAGATRLVARTTARTVREVLRQERVDLGHGYLTYYADGDTRRRGASLAALKRRYRAAGWELMEDELPDFLPVVLEFAALDATGAEVLREHRVGLELLRAALERRGSPYALVVGAVCGTLPPATAEQRAEVRRLAAGGPPAESVGRQT